jgi:DNA-binding transcriptional ArsR family regulator
MKSLLPLTSRVEPANDGANVISISEEAADEVFKTLSSSTARRILTLLYEEPRPASELAEETETSVQNVRYHLTNLSDANLISVADTWYSEKGTEMKVYAPTESTLVVCAGRQSTVDRLKSTIRELLGAIGIFGLASLLVQYLATVLGSEPDAATESGAMTAADTTAAAAESTGGGLTELLTEPGVVFFVGGLLAVTVVVVWSTRR